MPFQKGREKTGGRTKGSTNKATTELRNFLHDFAQKNKDKMQQDLDLLEPKDRMNAMLSLFEYCLPKLARTELTSDTQEGFIIQVVTHSQDASNQNQDQDT